MIIECALWIFFSPKYLYILIDKYVKTAQNFLNNSLFCASPIPVSLLPCSKFMPFFVIHKKNNIIPLSSCVVMHYYK